MELKLKDGDYVADASGTGWAEGIEELAQRCYEATARRRLPLCRITAAGSISSAIRASQRLLAAQQYVIEALEEDLHLRSLDIRYLKVDWMELELVFDYGKEALTITTRI